MKNFTKELKNKFGENSEKNVSNFNAFLALDGIVLDSRTTNYLKVLFEDSFLCGAEFVAKNR